MRETEVQLLGTVGRPALPVELDGRSVIGLGLEVGVDFLAVRAADLRGDERHRDRVEVDNRGRAVDEVLDDLARARAATCSTARSASRPAAVGAVVALPGLVDCDGPPADRARTSAGPASRSPPSSPTRLGAPGVPGPGRERGEPRRARRAVGGRRPRAARLHLHLGRARHRRRDHRGAASCSAARTASAASSGHTTVEPGRRGVRVRQPRLPRDPRRARRPAARRRAGAGRGRRPSSPTRAQARDARALEALEEAGHWLGVGVASAANLLNPRRRRRRRLLRAARRVARARARGGARRARALGRVGRAARRHLGAGRRGRGARRRSAGAAARLRGPGRRRRARRRRSAQRTPSRTSTRSWSSASLL